MIYRMRRNLHTSIFPYMDLNSCGNISLRMSKRRCSERWYITILLRDHLQEWRNNFSVTVGYICVAQMLSVTLQRMDSWIVPQQGIKWSVINKDCSMYCPMNFRSLLWWLIWRMHQKTGNQITMIWIGNLICDIWSLSWHGRKNSNMSKMNLLTLSSTIGCVPLMYSGRLSLLLQKDWKY